MERDCKDVLSILGHAGWFKKSYEVSLTAPLVQRMEFMGFFLLKKQHQAKKTVKIARETYWKISKYWAFWYSFFYFWICYTEFHFLDFLKNYKKGKKNKQISKKSCIDSSGLVALVCSASVAKQLFWNHLEIMLLFFFAGLSLPEWKWTCEERNIFLGHKLNIFFWFLFYCHNAAEFENEIWFENETWFENRNLEGFVQTFWGKLPYYLFFFFPKLAYLT